MQIILSIVLWILVLAQGGFFEKSFLLATLVLVIAFCSNCLKRKVSEIISLLSKGKLFIFLVFGICICYIISIFYHGTVIGNWRRLEYFTFILVFIMYLLLISNIEKLYYSIITLGIVESCIAMVAYLGFDLPHIIVNARYMGSFQYANATALFMGIVLLVQWGRLQEKNIFAHARIIMLFTLMLTFSAGGIGGYIVSLVVAEFVTYYKTDTNARDKALLRDILEIMVSFALAVGLYYVKFRIENNILTVLFVILAVTISVYFQKILTKLQAVANKKKNIFLLAFVTLEGCVGIFFYGKRVAGTGLERLQQVRDATKVLIENPLWGLGISGWERYIENNQEITYRVSLVHNSFLQLGIEAGIIAVLFCVGMIGNWYYKAIKKKINVEIWQLAIMTMVMIHFMADITFFFGGIIATVLICIFPRASNYDKNQVK